MHQIGAVTWRLAILGRFLGAARRDALALVQWAGALLLMAAYALGAIGADKVDGLLKLKSLAP